MNTYKIPVVWEMWGVYEIRAPTIEEAERQALEEEPLPEGHYLDDSMEVDRESGLYGEIKETE